MTKIPKIPFIDPITGKDMKYLWSTSPIKDKESRIAEMLPHGSGINGHWSIIEFDSHWECQNTYDTMNEYGMYDYTVSFSLIIPKKNPEKFRLHFHGYQYPVRKYNLRDYLESLFAEYIYDIIDKKGNVFE